MNAAARLVHHKTLSRQLIYVHSLSKKQLIISLLVLAIMLSQLGIIYFTHYQRLLYGNYQQLLTEKNQLQIKQGQLLLERSTWTVQSRIQAIAEKKLAMVMPDHKAIVIVRE